MIPLPVDAVRIGQCVTHHAAREPGREAAVHHATRLTYAELDRLSAAFAAYLQKHTDLLMALMVITFQNLLQRIFLKKCMK